MIHDYTGTSFGLVVGGEAALPLYAVMVWVNLGNGMRYGSRYLAIATGLALLALLVVYWLTPLWQAQPFMVLMLMITSTVIPVYAHLLLERTRKASEEAIAANLEKSRFLAQASHDLRQPIHSIGLFTACLREARLEAKLTQKVKRVLLVEDDDLQRDSIARLIGDDEQSHRPGQIRQGSHPAPGQSQQLPDLRQQNPEDYRLARRAGCAQLRRRDRRWRLQLDPF